MAQATEFIQDLAIVMMAAAVAGLVCKRIGLSPIVGYLAAGIVVGPHTAPYSLVTDLNRIHVMGQLGMVFLMFGIGLGFSLRRLRQLGVPMVLATAGTAFLVFNLGRVSGLAVGLVGAGAVSFASMLLSSSSAVIGKVIGDAGRGHERSSQLALGITLSEDVVAIVMLAVLGSYVQFGGVPARSESETAILPTVALFGGFVLVLATVGLLVVPRVLQRLSREASAELETIFVAGLLFGLSLMVVRAGYSIALGSFLLGAIIAETPQRAHVERSFSGLRDLFGSIFFVAAGMTIDIGALAGAVMPVVVLVLLALIGRPVAATCTLLLLGFDSRTAARAGLILTPLGEFGLIIAQLATSSGILPGQYMAVAVGGTIITSMISPQLIRHNRSLADRVVRWRVPGLDRLLALHRRALHVLQQQRDSSLLWRLSRKRLIQIALEIALVSAALIFARPVIAWIIRLIGAEVLPGVQTAVVCWSALGVLLLLPLIAIWRNIQAVTMIFADYLGRHGPALQRAQAAVTAGLQAVALFALAVWLLSFLPIETGGWMLVGVLVFLAVIAAVFWRRMIRWHSSLEIALETTMAEEERPERPALEWVDRYAPWGLQIGEIVLPDRFAFAGRQIGETALRTRFGCSIVAIERQNFTVANPGPNSHLFPGDRILILGTEEQVGAARDYLLGGQPESVAADLFRDVTVELVDVPSGSPASGRTLLELNWPRLLGVQVVGHERGQARNLSPSGSLRVEAGDRLLALGTPGQIKALRRWLQPPDPVEAPLTA